MDKEFAEAFKKEINTDPLSKIKNILIKEQQAKYDEFPRLVKIWISKALPGVTLKNHMIYTSSFGKVTGCGIILKGEDEVKILISYESNNDVTPSYKSIFDKGNKSSYVDKAGKADPARLGAAGTVAAKIQGGYNVWINKAQSGKESWVLKKDFRDPKKVVQFLKTKVKRMAKEEVGIEESQKLQATMALDDEGIKSKWKQGKLYIDKKDVKKAEKAFKKSFRKGGEPNLYHEGIDIEKADMKDVIKDFQDSDAPQFKGKSDKKKKEMAIAAKLSKEENEDDAPVGKSKKKSKKDVINTNPKMDETQMKKYKELYAGLQKKRAQEGTLKKTVSDYHKEEVVVKEAVTALGVEYEEQEFDAKYRPDVLYPNLNVNFAKYMDEGLEGPYELSGEVYFYDRKVHMFYSVTGEDYVDEETAKDIAYRLHKDGFYKPDLGR
jgi:hypothetical protein